MSDDQDFVPIEKLKKDFSQRSFEVESFLSYHKKTFISITDVNKQQGIFDEKILSASDFKHVIISGHFTADQKIHFSSIPGDLYIFASQVTVTAEHVKGNVYIYNRIGTYKNKDLFSYGPKFESQKVDGQLTIFSNSILNSDIKNINGGVTLYEGSAAQNIEHIVGNVELRENAVAQNITNIQGDISLNKGASSQNISSVIGNVKLENRSKSHGIFDIKGNIIMLRRVSCQYISGIKGAVNLIEGCQAGDISDVVGNIYLNDNIKCKAIDDIKGYVFALNHVTCGNISNVKGDLHFYDSSSCEDICAVKGNITLMGSTAGKISEYSGRVIK